MIRRAINNFFIGAWLSSCGGTDRYEGYEAGYSAAQEELGGMIVEAQDAISEAQTAADEAQAAAANTSTAAERFRSEDWRFVVSDVQDAAVAADTAAQDVGALLDDAEAALGEY